MSEFVVILQEPKHEGNIGAVARCMKNFGFYKLYLVNSPDLSDICYQRAKHAKDLILDAERFESLSDVTKEIDFLVGTTGIVNLNDKHHIRNPITPREFVNYAQRLEHRVGLLFGREDYGLYDNELLECDLLISIPTNKEYPIMNLSHAVAVVLYELASAELKFNIKGRKNTSNFERDKLFEQFKEFLVTFDYPKQKRENTEVLFRRFIGRATPSKWEFYTMMGVFGRASNKMKREKKAQKKTHGKK
jgi:TrmH family RNA methyltransferase